MSDGLKRVSIAIVFLLLVGTIAFGVYYVFFKPKTAPPGTTPGSGQQGAGGTLPQSGNAGTRPGSGEDPGDTGFPPSETVPEGESQAVAEPSTIILKESVAQQLAPSADGLSARFYDPVEGKFYKITAEGLTRPLGEKTYPNVDTVTWGNSSDQAILTYPDGAKVHVNFETGSQATIPKHWEDFSFSTNDTKIVAKTISTSPESRYLVVADPNGKNARAIEPLGDNQDKTYAAWTGNDQIIAYATVGEAIGLDRQQIVIVGKNHENYKSLLVEGRGFEPLWSPTGQWVAYSVWTTANGFKPELWVSGGAPGNLNENRRKLNIQTWAKKCAWQNDLYLYCAVPDSVSEGAGLQPEESMYSGKDSIYQINLETGTVTNLGQPSGEPSIKDPIVTSDGQNIIFTDASTGYLYTFRIP